MRETATVVRVHGDKATIQVKRRSACGDCDHACIIGQKNMMVEAEVKNVNNAKEGDEVQVELEFGSVMSASFIIYGVPFIFFMVGLFLGYYKLYTLISFDRELFSLVLGCVMMGISYLIIRFIDRKGAFSQRYQIKMVKEEDL